MALDWQEKPIFEHTDASPAVAPRAQLTHPSVHRAQFGGPCCTGKSGSARRGGIASSAAMAAWVAIVIDAAIRKKRNRR